MTADAPARALPSALDHLVYSTPDLDQTIADLEDLLGVRRMLSLVGATIPVKHGSRPHLVATLRTRNGDVDLD